MDAKEDAKFEAWYADCWPESIGKTDFEVGEWTRDREEAREVWDACLSAHEPERKAAKVLLALIAELKARDRQGGLFSIAGLCMEHGLNLDALTRE